MGLSTPWSIKVDGHVAPDAAGAAMYFAARADSLCHIITPLAAHTQRWAACARYALAPPVHTCSLAPCTPAYHPPSALRGSRLLWARDRIPDPPRGVPAAAGVLIF